MLVIWLVVSWIGFALIRPIIRYYQDPKGFRKYPNQNALSGISALAYGWEVGRRHPLFHTRRLHEQLVKNPMVRVGPNWLSFGRGQAVRDIYGFNSPCLKGSIYDSLQGGAGESLILTTSREFHSTRRRMVAASYAPGNIELWEPWVAESTAILISKLDELCTEAPSSPQDVPAPKDLTFDVKHWCMLFGFECAIKIGLSKDPGWVAQGSDLTLVTRKDGRKEHAHIIDCMHSSSRAASTLVWDAANFPWLKKATALLSPWYSRQWHNASNWAAYIEEITKERVWRGECDEDLNDLCQLMIRDRKGHAADISDIDRVTEVHQVGKSFSINPGL